jgi:hypothetical protein
LDQTIQEYEYIMNEVTFDTEEALHAANAGTCLTGEHDWRKSFVYGMYSCRKCEAKRMKKK